MTRFLHTQTVLSGEHADREGNCTQAAVATLLNLPLDRVPDFNNIHRGKPHSGWFWNHLRTFFLSQGYVFQGVNKATTYPCLYLAGGKTARGRSHMVVMKDGQVWHDPHPSRAGLESVDHVWLILPVDPSKFEPREDAGFQPDIYDFAGNVIGPEVDEDGTAL